MVQLENFKSFREFVRCRRTRTTSKWWRLKKTFTSWPVRSSCFFASWRNPWSLTSSLIVCWLRQVSVMTDSKVGLTPHQSHFTFSIFFFHSSRYFEEGRLRQKIQGHSQRTSRVQPGNTVLCFESPERVSWSFVNLIKMPQVTLSKLSWVFVDWQDRIHGPCFIHSSFWTSYKSPLSYFLDWQVRLFESVIVIFTSWTLSERSYVLVDGHAFNFRSPFVHSPFELCQNVVKFLFIDKVVFLDLRLSVRSLNFIIIKRS